MKKNFLLLFTLLLLALVGTGCGDKVSGSLGKDGAELVGTWNGVGNALGRDDSYSCDYLSFSIDKEGTFTLKDIAQNKTCLSGSLSAKSEKFSLIPEKKPQRNFLLVGTASVLAAHCLTICRQKISWYLLMIMSATFLKSKTILPNKLLNPARRAPR